MKVNFKGNPVAISEAIKVGDSIKDTKVVGKDLSVINLNEDAIVICVPSIDTPVCAKEAREFNVKANKLGMKVYVVSMDLPFAMGRFCSAEGLENIIPVSDFRYGEFVKNYGCRVLEGALEGLTTRAIFVQKAGKIVYSEVCAEITELPDFDALEKALA
ncbi:thiol peroxidase [Campylobacter sp. Cr9]|uniref:thiol peroxidase n=1 Tax=Campylobacter sp. Cr9 TaxID=2735728 RepID=UPI00301443C5|nr:thiol peroxidase [Campylobacter sp. Cr9]